MNDSIINDASWVGYELSVELKKKGVNVKYFPRTRTFYGKTLGVFRNSLKASGLLHVNYALQDAFITGLIHNRIDILHAHGSDVRYSMKTRRWGWMVKSNLIKAKKVLVSTPDIISVVKPIRNDVQYLPNPIDTDRFKPSEQFNPKFSCLYIRHKYEVFPDDLAEILSKKKIPVFTISPGLYSYFEMHNVYPKFGVFIDRFSIPSFSKSCLESMSCGLSTIDYRHKNHLLERVNYLQKTRSILDEGKLNRLYVIEKHDVSNVCDELIKIYQDIF